jgi:DNA-binding XRE family transcriptional regulator
MAFHGIMTQKQRMQNLKGRIERARLARRKERTEPARPRLLRELRSRRRVTQNAIADRLGIRQPTVSKLEQRKDLNLSTLRRYVQALGGELQVTAKFKDGTVE